MSNPLVDRLEPIDFCGCGDTGYLTKQTIIIPLLEGTGEILNVPVYKCNDPTCPQYTIPAQVARRIDDIADHLEHTKQSKAEFRWENEPTDDGTQDKSYRSETNFSRFEAFTLKMINKEFEDAKVVFVIPGQAIFIQHKVDQFEYYVIEVEETDDDQSQKDLHFTFTKFYLDEDHFDYNHYLSAYDEGNIKLLGTLTLDELDDVLVDEFGY